MVRSKIQNTELRNTKDTNVPFNWPGSSAGPGSRHSAQGGEDKGRVGGGVLATPGTLPNVHRYSLLPNVLVVQYCTLLIRVFTLDWTTTAQPITHFIKCPPRTVAWTAHQPSLGFCSRHCLLPFTQSVLLWLLFGAPPVFSRAFIFIRLEFYNWQPLSLTE